MRIISRNSSISLIALLSFAATPIFASLLAPSAAAQAATANSGTISGTVTDPSGAAVQGASVVLTNSNSGYTRTVTTGPDGAYQFANIPFNPYRVVIVMPGFSTSDNVLRIHTSVPIVLKTALTVASAGEQVTVEAEGNCSTTTPPPTLTSSARSSPSSPSSPSPPASAPSSPSPPPASPQTPTASSTASATTPKTPSTKTVSP